MGGVTGSLLVGLFAVSEVNGMADGLEQFLIQLLGVCIVVIYTVVVCWLIFKVCGGLFDIKVSERVQESGLDKEYLTEIE